MSSQCTVADDWNLISQRQEQVESTGQLHEEATRRFSHVLHHNPNNIHNFGPLPDYGVAELTWENGHPTSHGLGGLHHSDPPKPTWVRTNGTLESIVHQASNHTKDNLLSSYQQDHQTNPTTNIPASSDYHAQFEPALSRKRRWSDSDMFAKSADGTRDVYGEHRTCASASAIFVRDHTNDTNNQGQDEDRDIKTEVTARFHSGRRTRAAAVHNLSERRRRDRINQKMRDLQKLVPNANKTDKSSMLDEIISYLKQLQAQVHLMSNLRNSSTPHHQPTMPLGMQQQYLQMSLMAARMGMNTTDMFRMSNLARGPPPCFPPFVHPAMAAATPTTFVHPPNLVVPPLMVPHARPNQERASTSCSVPLHDPYGALLAQSMNMDLYSKMATLWGHQINQVNQGTSKFNLKDE